MSKDKSNNQNTADTNPAKPNPANPTASPNVNPNVPETRPVGANNSVNENESNVRTAEAAARSNPNNAKDRFTPEDRVANETNANSRDVKSGAKTPQQAELENNLRAEQSLAPAEGLTREQIERANPGLGGAAAAGDVVTIDPHVQAQQELINERAEENRVAQEEKAIADADDNGETKRRIENQRKHEEETLEQNQHTDVGVKGKADDAYRVNQGRQTAKEIKEGKGSDVNQPSNKPK